MPDRNHKDVVLLLGNQLFPFQYVKPYRQAQFFMAEDMGLCTYAKHHKQKITLFLAAMRAYADGLRGNGIHLHYNNLEDRSAADLTTTYEDKLHRFFDHNARDAERLVTFEIEDKFFESRITKFASDRGIELVFIPSPMFLTPRDAFDRYLGERKPFMAKFYEWQRNRLGILIESDGTPVGGRWSYDDENRKRLPKSVEPPGISIPKRNAHVVDVMRIVEEHFSDHPGTLEDWWLPTTRRQALVWLNNFLKERFSSFGDYEDALSTRDPFLFHSALSPMLNLGLLTPAEVLERALAYADKNDVPFNSLEGFVRQIIGWREFIRGVYQRYSEKQESTNHFGHRRRMKQCWWTGDTGLVPLDDAIRKALRFGWNHHIERLMILANLMNLCEIEPLEVYEWFMSMFVDSSDWVMGPNVYGMGLMSDGGIFATKPYICGSNYILKMSDYSKPKSGESIFDLGNNLGGSTTWTDVIDGLYWRFIECHRDFFSRNPRMSMMARSLDKMNKERRQRLFTTAERFIDEVTTTS